MSLVIKELNTLNTSTNDNIIEDSSASLILTTQTSSTSSALSTSGINNNNHQRRIINTYLGGSSSCLFQTSSDNDSENDDCDYCGGSSDGEFGSNNNNNNYNNNAPAIAPKATPLRTIRNSMLLATPVVIDQVDEAVIAITQDHHQKQQEQHQMSFITNSHCQPLNRLNNHQGSSSPNKQKQFLTFNNNNNYPIASRLANITDEILTLQIEESFDSDSGFLKSNSFGGVHDSGDIQRKRTYSMEMTSAKFQSSKQAQTEQQPPIYQSPLSPNDNNVGLGVSSTTKITNTMLQQFKHQSFHSESPKHVSYFHRHNYYNHHGTLTSKITLPSTSSTTNNSNKYSGSPNISPSKSNKYKMIIFLFRVIINKVVF